MNPTTHPTRRRFLAAASAAAAATAVLPLRAARAQVYGPDAARFGLNPDDPGDQTAALQRAVDETQVTGTPLFLPPGRYMTTGIRLGSGARLTGVPGATRLVSMGGGPLVSATGARSVALEGIALDGMARDLSGARGLVALEGVDEIDICDCRIENSWSNGLALTGCGGRVVGTTIAGAYGGGLFSLDGRALEISGNRVIDCADNGIMVWQSAKQPDGARIVDNYVARIDNRSGGNGPFGNGIQVFRGGGVTISGNRVTDCTYSAIRVNSGTDVIVSQNNCTRLGEVAIFVEFGFDGAIVANNLVDTATTGISVTNLDQGGHLAVVSGNLVRNMSIGEFAEPRGNGIFVAADTSLTGNVVENVESTGYTLGYGPYLRDVVATGNLVRTAAIGFKISVAEGISNVLVADNLISDVSKAAILGMAWEEVVTGDLAKGGAEAYPQLTIRGNRVG
jgi:uncharacterized secreted repeat protein (TIGR03808 family)